MKAIVTVIGKDRVGITASVCSLLAQHSINILDISQTVLQEYFTMVMLVDTSACSASIGAMSDLLGRACPSASSERIFLTRCIGSNGLRCPFRAEQSSAARRGRTGTNVGLLFAPGLP